MLYSSRRDYDIKHSSVSLRHLLAVSIAAAEAGGLKVREIRFSSNLKQSSKGKTKEGANDPLTAGDISSHRVMFHGLQQAFPRLKIISEEHDNMKKDETSNEAAILPRWDAIVKIVDDIAVSVDNVVVWIDPLDATQEYTENLLSYVTTMVCVAVRGKPVIGVIHQPFSNNTVWAWDRHGTSGLHKADVKSDQAEAKSPAIIISRSHPGQVDEVIKSKFGSSTKIIPAGGAGYKSIQVAEEKADAYIHTTLIKKWDICAGNALLNALGGRMTTLDGDTIYYGDPKDVKNSKGLIATLLKHKHFVEILAALRH